MIINWSQSFQSIVNWHFLASASGRVKISNLMSYEGNEKEKTRLQPTCSWPDFVALDLPSKLSLNITTLWLSLWPVDLWEAFNIPPWPSISWPLKFYVQITTQNAVVLTLHQEAPMFGPYWPYVYQYSGFPSSAWVLSFTYSMLDFPLSGLPLCAKLLHKPISKDSPYFQI